MRILGISAFFHDSAAAILEDGMILCACEEERFSRVKHDASFPVQAISWCLSFCRLSMNDLDAVVFYEKPFTKFGRILSTHLSNAPFGLASFLQSMPSWLNSKLFMRKTILQELGKIEKIRNKNLKILFSQHHLSHAASAYFLSPFDDAAILTVDGVGEWATAAILHGKGNKISLLRKLNFPDSPGLLYSSFTDYCGFRVNSGEYKLMGLAPFGNSQSPTYLKCRQAILSELLDIREDGSIAMNQAYFKYTRGRRMVDDQKWEKLFGFERRTSEMPIEQPYCDMALAIQRVTEEIVIKMAKEAQRITHARTLCMAGGVALNAVANGKLSSSNLYEELFIQPASGDAGGALGAALAGYHIYFDKPYRSKGNASFTSLLGPESSSEEVKKVASKFNAPYECLEDLPAIAKRTAHLLQEGAIVGWYQGRAEFGPRALGCRSILADPRLPRMQSTLNQRIKFRENFRPFAPAVLAEDASQYFDMRSSSPYMLEVYGVAKSRLAKLPEDFRNWRLEDKLFYPKSTIPAVTHVDGSARVQTVDREKNPPFRRLLQEFKQLTGCPVVINTSFNVRNEPIVNSAEDAYRCFMRTGMDYLVIENFIFSKDAQPIWKESPDWQQHQIPD